LIGPASFNKSLELDPNSTKAWCYKGRVLKYIGRYEEANIAFNKTLDLYNKETDKDPKKIHAWDEMGWILNDLDQTTEANKAFEKVKELEER
jgi:tetratricopeptide (TPR) repeat protein